jgi:hypothetical protein
MNKPSLKELQTKKYEIRERYFTSSPLVTEPNLIELPDDETIIGIEWIKGTTNRFVIFSVKDVTNAD